MYKAENRVFGHLGIFSRHTLPITCTASLLHQGLSEFYGDLVYKFKKIRGMTDFSDQFRKIIMRYKRIGYNLNVMRQSACLVINQSRLMAMLHSLIARRWIGRQTP